MPPRSSVAAVTGGNGKLAPKGPRDPHRAKKEEPKAEDTSVPTIKSQITNPNKASSGKSFLDALRAKRPAPPAAAPTPTRTAPPAQEEPEATPTPTPTPTPTSAPASAPTSAPASAPAQRTSPSPAAAAPVEREPSAPAAAAAPTSPPPASDRGAIDTAAAEEPEAPAHPPPHNPVMLPGADAHFSWAHDDDYTFVSQFTQPEQEQEQEQEPAAAPRYNAQYPQEVLDTNALVAGRIAFKAPAEHQTLESTAAALEKERQELMEARHAFEEFCAQQRRELNDKHSQFLLAERQINDQREALQQERNKLLAEQQALAQAQAQAQAQVQLQQKQQQQQQQQSVNAAPPTMSVQPHQQQSLPPQSAPGYTHSPNSLQWNMAPQQEPWRDSVNSMPTVPPYNANQQFYQHNNPPYQQYRGKTPYSGNSYGNGMMGRGAGAPQVMGRGNMRPNNHMSQGFNGRQMGVGPRGANVENGGNGMYMPRPQATAYLPQQAQDAYGWKQ